jgi:dihydroflavonol-4-reductase
VTGATGFIGSWLVRHLVEKSHSVSILSRRHELPTEFRGLPVKVVTGDLDKLDLLKSAFSGSDAVFHLAGFIAYKKNDIPEMEKTNVVGTQNVVDAVLAAKTPRLIHMSTVNAIGASLNQAVLNEASEYNLSKYNFGYSQTKLAAEKIVMTACREKNLNAVVVNPSNVYGYGDAKKGSRSTQLKVARGKFPFYTSGGVSIANVHDVVAATVTAYQKGRTGERYILGGENITIEEMFRLIATAAGVKPPSFKLPNEAVKILGYLGDGLETLNLKGPINSATAFLSLMFHWFDSSKAQKELDYRVTPAKISIEQSVAYMRESGLIG